MTRRTALALGVAAIAGRGEVNYRVYSRVLPDYLRRLAEESRTLRDAALGRLTTVAAIRERQSWVRDTFWSLIGGRPAVTPLNLRIAGGFERERYRVEKLIYESQPGLHIPANLYIPKDRRPPFPGVLFQMGQRKRQSIRDVSEMLPRACQTRLSRTRVRSYGTRGTDLLPETQ